MKFIEMYKVYSNKAIKILGLWGGERKSRGQFNLYKSIYKGIKRGSE